MENSLETIDQITLAIREISAPLMAAEIKTDEDCAKALTSGKYLTALEKRAKAWKDLVNGPLKAQIDRNNETARPLLELINQVKDKIRSAATAIEIEKSRQRDIENQKLLEEQRAAREQINQMAREES